MKPWQQYQHDTAELLRELGFTAVVDDQIEEPNGTVHNVDVLARRTVAGVEVKWIVECKRWDKRVPKEKVAALKAIVDGVGADRGLLMSDKGFQSGAFRMAKQKNITLSSLPELRIDAAEELLATRVAVAERRLMDLELKVNRDLRPSAIQDARMLRSFATRLPSELVEEFAARATAVDFVDGQIEVVNQIEGFTLDDQLEFMPHPTELALPWKPGVDQQAMEGASAALHYTTQALYQGRLGYWPAFCPAPEGIKLAWSMPQLIEVVESSLPGLEKKVAKQEKNAARVPRPAWPHQAR